MSDFVLPAKLDDDKFRVTICLEIFNANLIGELHPNHEGIVLRYIGVVWVVLNRWVEIPKCCMIRRGMMLNMDPGST